MKMQRLLLGIVLACGMVGTVQADTLVSGPVYGGPTQKRVACQVFNAGNTRDHLRQYGRSLANFRPLSH